VPFVIGTTWGSVRSADIYIGGEIARNVPIQDIGDNPGGTTSVPTDCSSRGTIQNTLAQLGSNGILGVGPFKNDCDACLQQVYAATYYTCTSSGCTGSTVTSAQVVRNPVASFAVDNNGVLINLPAVSAAGSTGLTGSLIFGIGTQSNNALTGSAVIYSVDSHDNFTTTYNGTTMTSYLDSGSNGLFFTDANIPRCTNVNTWAYCPASTLSLTATNTAATGSPSHVVSLPTPTIVHANNLFTSANIVAGNIGGPGSANTFAWGLPFFYGRPVYTAIAGLNAGGSVGPYWAY
jgi:hypothetical protein